MKESTSKPHSKALFTGRQDKYRNIYAWYCPRPVLTKLCVLDKPCFHCLKVISKFFEKSIWISGTRIFKHIPKAKIDPSQVVITHRLAAPICHVKFWLISFLQTNKQARQPIILSHLSSDKDSLILSSLHWGLTKLPEISSSETIHLTALQSWKLVGIKYSYCREI